jgi:hypothetical protein
LHRGSGEAIQAAVFSISGPCVQAGAFSRMQTILRQINRECIACPSVHGLRDSYRDLRSCAALTPSARPYLRMVDFPECPIPITVLLPERLWAFSPSATPWVRPRHTLPRSFPVARKTCQYRLRIVEMSIERPVKPHYAGQCCHSVRSAPVGLGC